MTIISPSILSADLLNLEKELKEVEKAGADWHHVDVMDGHFVPNLTFGLPLVGALKKISSLPLDVHLMISNPESMVPEYIKAGADLLTFHIEAATHSHRLVELIKASGIKAGVAINPGTPLGHLDPLLPWVDLVLVMSVNPGFGGQSFISASNARICLLTQKLKNLGRYDEVTIEVDGGINHTTIHGAYGAGAKAFVAGSYIYGALERASAIGQLRKLSTSS